jgi:hypothetical protein
MGQYRTTRRQRGVVPGRRRRRRSRRTAAWVGRALKVTLLVIALVAAAAWGAACYTSVRNPGEKTAPYPYPYPGSMP